MNQFEQSHFELIAEGIRLFNAQKYWECHEELEHHWLEEAGPLRNVYWAIIQIAAAMIHFRDGNIVGARGLHYKALEKFERCEKFAVESPVLEKYLSWSELKALARAVPKEPVLKDFEALFEFRFKDPDQWK